jgi:hypothetical protein
MGAGAGASGKESQMFASEVATSSDAEIHWYEASGIGRKEFKIKRFL